MHLTIFVNLAVLTTFRATTGKSNDLCDEVVRTDDQNRTWTEDVGIYQTDAGIRCEPFHLAYVFASLAVAMVCVFAGAISAFPRNKTTPDDN